MSNDNDLVIRAGQTAHHQYALDVTPERAGWRFSGLKIVELSAGESLELSTGQDEALVLPLSGGCSVESEGTSYELAGRPDVFSEVTDYIYLPRETTAIITSARGGRFAVPTARATALSLAVVAVLGFALNDSGITIPSMMAAVFESALVVLLARIVFTESRSRS